MSDEFNRNPLPEDADESASLRAALRALPLVAPPRSALPDLKQHWNTRASVPTWQRRSRVWLALAATLAAVAIGVQLWPGEHESSIATGASDPSRIDNLMAQSAAWENTLRSFDQQNIPMTAGNALAGAELEDLIGLTDLQLGATENLAQAESLWQRRVRLMSRLAEVRSQSAWQRGSSDQNPMILAATYPVN